MKKYTVHIICLLYTSFDVISSKAKSITKSEDVLDNYLDKQDGVYEVKENTDGDLEVTAPYQTKRLIVESNQAVSYTHLER